MIRRLLVCFAFVAFAAITSSPAQAWDGEMTLLQPAADAVVSPASSVKFSWNASPYGDDTNSLPYAIYFEVATDAGFSNLVVSKRSTCYSPASCPSSSTEGPFRARLYYWRVRADYQACLDGLAARGMLDSGAANMCKPKTSRVRSFTSRTATSPPPPSGKDRTAPHVRALASSGRRGFNTRLKFNAGDNSGSFGVGLTVFKGPSLAAAWTRRFPVARTPSGAFYINYKSKVAFRGRFCARTFDAAGNKSALSCTQLVIR